MTVALKTIFYLLTFSFANTLFAQGISWDDLTSDQKDLLKKHEQTWANIDIDRRDRIVKGTERWLSMNKDQKSFAQQRFNEWQELGLDEKNGIRAVSYTHLRAHET